MLSSGQGVPCLVLTILFCKMAHQPGLWEAERTQYQPRPSREQGPAHGIGGQWVQLDLPSSPDFCRPHPCSCVPGTTMASAAAEAEKGSPIVVGLLVLGNIIILVRHPPVLGAEWEVGRRGSPEPEGGG